MTMIILDVFCTKCKHYIESREKDVTIENMGQLIYHKDYCGGDKCELEKTN